MPLLGLPWSQVEDHLSQFDMPCAVLEVLAGFLEQYLFHLGPLRTLRLVDIPHPDPQGGGSGRGIFPKGEAVDVVEELVCSRTRRRGPKKNESRSVGWGLGGVGRGGGWVETEQGS